MASRKWVDKIMMSLRTTFHISDSDSTADDYELMLVKLTDAQCAEIHEWLITTPMEFAPKPGTLYARAKGNQRQTVTSDYLMDFYVDEQGGVCVPSMLDDKGEISPVLTDQPNSIKIEVGREEYQRRMKQLRDLMSGTIAMEGNYASLQRSQIHRRNEMRRELGWKEIEGAQK